MQIETLDRPPAPRNMPPVDRTEAPCNPPSPPPCKTAGEILAGADWAVLIPRAAVMEHNNPQDSAALAVWFACRAWKDRGIPGRPPGGWARLAGMSERGFFNARRRAIDLGLIKTVPGGAGITPLVRHEPGQGQYSRVPAEILFDRTLSRTARRVFVALSLYRSGFGDSRVAVQTLAKASATNRRDVQRALRELENHFHITRMGAVGRGSQRYFVKGQAIDARPSTVSYPQKGTPPKVKIGTETRPTEAKSALRPAPKSALRPAPSRVFKSLESHEGHATPALAEGPAPRGPTKAEARCTLNLFGMRGVGADFGKQANGGLQQGDAKRVAEPPKPRWRTLSDDTARKFFAGWTAQDFKSAIKSAEASLAHATVEESRTLKVQILDYSDQLQRMLP